jgi:hypothetical protein
MKVRSEACTYIEAPDDGRSTILSDFKWQSTLIVQLLVKLTTVTGSSYSERCGKCGCIVSRNLMEVGVWNNLHSV